MPALVASTMNCLLLKTGLFFRLSQKPHQQVPEHLTAWQIFDEITAAKIWQNCKCQGRAEIHLSKYSRFLLQIDSFTAENQIMTSFAYYVMVCIGKGNTLVLKPFFEKSNQNIVAFLQHLFRQNFVTREHNCRKLCPFIYLTAQPWALAPLSINKETTIMSITETWVSCYKAVIRNWSQQIKIITEKQREERNISFQRSKSHKVMFNKERVFLTEQMYWHLRSARSYTAMQYFQEEKKKQETTKAALEVTHEAAQKKLEIQYLVLPRSGGWATKDFFLFWEASTCEEGWPFTPAEVCGNRNLWDWTWFIKRAGSIKNSYFWPSILLPVRLKTWHYRGGKKTLSCCVVFLQLSDYVHVPVHLGSFQ